jgi:hypothetical protein
MSDQRSTRYFDTIIGERASRLSEEEALEGGATVSVETCTDLCEEDFHSAIRENFKDFMRGVRSLSAKDQELLLSYYVLGKTQMTLAVIDCVTQTVCSSLIRMAVKRLGSLVYGNIADYLPELLESHGLEKILKGVALSEAIFLYDQTRSFQHVADKFKLHRPDIRHAMRQASNKLLESSNERDQFIGAWIVGLINKASASGQGLSVRQMAKEGNLYFRDPSFLGEFRIDLSDPAVDQLFTSRANR